MRALSNAAQIFLRRSCTLQTARTKSGRRGSNPRHQAWKACALPAELLPHNQPCSPRGERQEKTNSNFRESRSNNGGGRIRTFEGLRRQIYSLLPLATWVPHPLRDRKKTPAPPAKSPIYSDSKADGENRTRNRLITNQVLCQLSYVSGRLFARDSQAIKAPEVSQSVALTRLSRSPGPPFQPYRTFFQRVPVGESSIAIPFSSNALRTESAAAKSRR